MINHGQHAAFANYYFTDVVPLYILYLKWTMKLLSNNYSYLPYIMNYTNAVLGLLTIIPAYILVSRLFKNAAIAFCSVLALIFSPSFYQATIMGFPHLPAFFFIMLSFCFYISALDHEKRRETWPLMVISTLFLTIAFLFKSDFVLAAGAFFGFLFIRKVRDKKKILMTLFIISCAGVLFLLFRSLILGATGGTTMSKDGLLNWYNYSLIIPNNFTYLIRQTKPVAYGAGIATFFLGILSFFYYALRKRRDMLAFMVFWGALPSLFWLVMIGNNARHNMLTILPLLVLSVVFFYEKFPKQVVTCTIILILGNFFATSPSYSILTPSGNLFKSNKLLEDRMMMFQSRAEEIAQMDENKIAVLGYFHNPSVVFEILKKSPSYRAQKVGREDYRITTEEKEFVFLYFVIVKTEDFDAEIDYFLDRYDLEGYLFTSATYDLAPLEVRGMKTRSFGVIERSQI